MRACRMEDDTAACRSASSTRPGAAAGLTIRAMTADDAEAVLRIYQEGIDTGQATFAPAAPDWQTWDADHLPHSRLLARLDGRPVGWAALSSVSGRAVYRGVAESSVYIVREAWGRGIGRRLLAALIAASEAAGIWTLQAGAFPENAASIALHEKAGFRVVGLRERIGLMEHGPFAGRWRDVVYMERRSKFVGNE